MNQIYECVYTHQKIQKHKKWKDGYFEIIKTNDSTKVILYDINKNIVENCFYNISSLNVNDDINLPQNLVDIIDKDTFALNIFENENKKKRINISNENEYVYNKKIKNTEINNAYEENKNISKNNEIDTSYNLNKNNINNYNNLLTKKKRFNLYTVDNIKKNNFNQCIKTNNETNLVSKEYKKKYIFKKQKTYDCILTNKNEYNEKKEDNNDLINITYTTKQLFQKKKGIKWLDGFIKINNDNIILYNIEKEILHTNKYITDVEYIYFGNYIVYNNFYKDFYENQNNNFKNNNKYNEKYKYSNNLCNKIKEKNLHDINIIDNDKNYLQNNFQLNEPIYNVSNLEYYTSKQKHKINTNNDILDEYDEIKEYYIYENNNKTMYLVNPKENEQNQNNTNENNLGIYDEMINMGKYISKNNFTHINSNNIALTDTSNLINDNYKNYDKDNNKNNNYKDDKNNRDNNYINDNNENDNQKNYDEDNNYKDYDENNNYKDYDEDNNYKVYDEDKNYKVYNENNNLINIENKKKEENILHNENNINISNNILINNNEYLDVYRIKNLFHFININKIFLNENNYLNNGDIYIPIYFDLPKEKKEVI